MYYKRNCPHLRHLLVIGYVAFSLVISGCGFTPFCASGRKFDPQSTTKLSENSSTRDDVRRIFGKPQETNLADLNQATWWRYNYVYLGVLAIESGTLDIYFRDDLVERYSIQIDQNRL